MTGAGRSLAGLHPVADPLFLRRPGSEEWIGKTACTVAVMIEPSRDGDGAAGAQIQGDRRPVSANFSETGANFSETGANFTGTGHPPQPRPWWSVAGCARRFVAGGGQRCWRTLAARSGCPNRSCNPADTTGRDAGMLRVPPRRIGGRAGYRSWLLVVLVAVAHRRLGPSSSARTSTMDRALPSSVVQVRCWSRPTTTTRLPLDSDWAACSAWSRHATTVKNDASCSRRPDTATRNVARGGGGRPRD
jgi:hypothetical protein